MSAELPAGYLPVEAGSARGFALTAAAPWLEAVLREHGTLRTWADEAAESSLGGGRGMARVVAAPVPGPGASAQWVCRRFRRGGAAAPLLGDRYAALGEHRHLAELRASCAARDRGVLTPAVVAGAVYPAGAFYRADLVTECVADTRSLADAMFGRDPGPAWAKLLYAAGRLVGSLERARVEHRDLNANNILIPTKPFTYDFWVVDLDRCRVLPLEARPPGRAMRRRLERSLAKLGRRRARPIHPVVWEPLRFGYEDVV